MAVTWDQLAEVLRQNLTVVEDQGTLLRFEENLAGGRQQTILVTRRTIKAFPDQEFVLIVSAFADAGSVAIGDVLREASSYIVGGVVQYGNELALRHTVPLSNLDLRNELWIPYEIVAHTADELEAKFGSGDKF